MTFDHVQVESGAWEHRSRILALLQQYNESQAGSAAAMPLALLLRDSADDVVGGLFGVSAYGWMIIELVFVPGQLRGRGVGASLLARAEEVARERGCAGLWLDTFSFQARGFYEKLGYELFGTVEDHPAGGARYFLKKALA